MMMHPDLVLAQANDRQRELIAEADRERLLAIARRARRGRRARQKAPVRGQPVVVPAR
jgi:hypothetical protein